MLGDALTRRVVHGWIALLGLVGVTTCLDVLAIGSSLSDELFELFQLLFY